MLNLGPLPRGGALNWMREAALQGLPDVEYNGTGGDIFKGRDAAAAEAGVKQIGKVAAGLRAIFIDGANVVFS